MYVYIESYTPGYKNICIGEINLKDPMLTLLATRWISYGYGSKIGYAKDRKIVS